jgi:polyisoprenoid-binding protein YceI
MVPIVATVHIQLIDVGASAKTKVKRSDFGMQWNGVLEAGGVLVGDEVTIQIEVSLVRSK